MCFLSVNMVYCVELVSHVKPRLHSWNNPTWSWHIIPFICCWFGLLEFSWGFLASIFIRDIGLFSCDVSVWLWCQDNTALIERELYASSESKIYRPSLQQNEFAPCTLVFSHFSCLISEGGGWNEGAAWAVPDDGESAAGRRPPCRQSTAAAVLPRDLLRSRIKTLHHLSASFQ